MKLDSQVDAYQKFAFVERKRTVVVQVEQRSGGLISISSSDTFSFDAPDDPAAMRAAIGERGPGTYRWSLRERDGTVLVKGTLEVQAAEDVQAATQ